MVVYYEWSFIFTLLDTQVVYDILPLLLDWS